jgi:prepilin-type processing-associated H-X9-DG protein
MVLQHKKEAIMNSKFIKTWVLKLLTYFAIIFMLATFGIMFLDWRINHHHKRDPRFACASWFKQVGLSLKQYAMDYEDFFPPQNNAKGLDKLRELGYLTEYRVYVCPGSNIEKGIKGAITEENSSYIYLGGFKEFQNPNIPLAFDKPNNHPDYVNVVFLDGHIMGYPTSASKSCEQIIIFLNKKHKYPEKLFKKLLYKARKIDNILPKK